MEQQPEQAAAGEKNFFRNKTYIFLLAILIAFAAILIFLTRMNFEWSLDGYYNARLAQSGPVVYLGEKFPWLEVSILHEWYADKELVYHCLLDWVFRIMEKGGYSLNPPFRIPHLFFVGFYALMFLFTAKRLGVRESLLIPGGLFAVFLCASGTTRLFMLRSHVFSIALLCGMILLLAGRKPGRLLYFLTFLLSFLYSWSYSIPFFILIVPCAFAFFRSMRKGGSAEWLLPLWSGLGILSGMILHPQFPANILLLWRQSFHAMFALSRGAEAAYLAPVEMEPISWSLFLYTSPALLLLLLGIAATAWIARKNRKWILDPELYAVCGLALFFSVGIFHAYRAVEYAVPFIALFVLFASEKVMQNVQNICFRKIFISVLSVTAVALAAFDIWKVTTLKKTFPEPVKLCQYLRENLPMGCTVYNPIWGDFPRLYFYDPLHTWQWGIDPVLSLGTDKKKYDIMVKCIHPSAKCPSQKEVAETLQTPVTVVLYPSWKAAQHLWDAGWVCAKSFVDPGEEEGWVFFYPGEDKKKAEKTDPGEQTAEKK